MAAQIVDFGAHVAVKIFEASEHVAYKLLVVACFAISQKFLITSTNAVQDVDSFRWFG